MDFVGSVSEVPGSLGVSEAPTIHVTGVTRKTEVHLRRSIVVMSQYTFKVCAEKYFSWIYGIWNIHLTGNHHVRLCQPYNPCS
jgi:hypothetical protein